MSAPPTTSIGKMVAMNDRYHAAKVHDEGIKKVSRVCEWHERQYRNSLRPSQHHQQREDISEETMQAGEMELVDEFKVEARLSRKQLTEERRAKIQALYRAEAEMYYDELAMKGLAPLPVV